MDLGEGALWEGIDNKSWISDKTIVRVELAFGNLQWITYYMWWEQREATFCGTPQIWRTPFLNSHILLTGTHSPAQ